MRILEVTQRYPPALGGVETQVSGLTRQLSALGHRVEVLTTDLRRDRPFERLGALPDGELSSAVRRHRALRGLPFPHGTGLVAPGMATELLRTNAEVVHAHAFGYPPTWFAAAARRLHRTPLVIETHADQGRGSSGGLVYARLMARATLRPADRVVADTHLEAELLARWGVAPERIVVVPNGIDLAEFRQLERDRSASRPPTILFVGRLYPEQKGLGPLLEAFALVAPEKRAELRLVGEDWGGADLVRRLAAARGVAERVVLRGPLSRAALLEEYAAADLLVLPSLFEPFGIVLLEAMAAGLPVVASRVGGVPEVVEEDRTALLVPPGDPLALARALERVLDEAELARDLGRRGRLRVEAFSWERLAPRWVALFEELTGSL